MEWNILNWLCFGIFLGAQLQYKGRFRDDSKFCEWVMILVLAANGVLCLADLLEWIQL